jgi:hypothetical protein
MALGSWEASAQVPWDVYADPISGGACDVVNAGNLEFVVLTDTGEIVVITGEDYLLELPFVDEDGVFFFDGIPFGEIAFADDGDGFRTVWLIAPDDTVLELDPDTGEPIFTDLFPEDFAGVPCDAFDLWDDDDFDEVPDDFDLCPDTPPDEFVDEDGCACFEIDSDGDGLDDCDDECPFDFGDDLSGCPCEAFDEDDDGINDCFDECPNTPLGEDVDEDGCEIVVVVPPPVFVTCGGLSSLTMVSTLCGLMGLRLVSRRRYRGPAARAFAEEAAA